MYPVTDALDFALLGAANWVTLFTSKDLLHQPSEHGKTIVRIMLLTNFLYSLSYLDINSSVRENRQNSNNANPADNAANNPHAGIDCKC